MRTNTPIQLPGHDRVEPLIPQPAGMRGCVAKHHAGMRRGEAGFTLIEVMTAMVIMTIGLFAVLNLQVVAVRGNSFARSRTDAQKIAQGVSDEIRTKSQEWLSSSLINRTWSDVFTPASDFPLVLSDKPSDGSNLSLDDLRAVRSYQGNTIASGEDLLGADLVDVNGNTGLGAMYRVHYIAYPVVMDGLNAELVRVLVFVSWDSKDHGRQDYAWDEWDESFFDRHIVCVTQLISRRHF